MDDLISRHAAMNEMSKQHTYKMFMGEDTVYLDANDVGSVLASLPSAQQWHVIKKRPMTNDERIEWSERFGYDVEDEDAFIYSNLPDDGEDVFVSTQYGSVYVDKFRQDEGFYFEEFGDMDVIVAWMPLPKPYEREEE